jgi:hypothetical protein
MTSTTSSPHDELRELLEQAIAVTEHANWRLAALVDKLRETTEADADA